MSAAIDWEAVEREYRAGQFSVAELARQHGCSRGAIQKRAKLKGWKRDLSDNIRSATRAKVAAAVAGATSRASDASIVESAATRAADVALAHLATLRRLKRLNHAAMTLMEKQLGLVPDQRSASADDLTAVLAPDKITPGNLFMGKSDGVANVLRAITDMSERTQRLERQALNMDDQPPPPSEDFEAILLKAKERVRAARKAAATGADSGS